MRLLAGLRQDLRYGARTLRRSPGFTAVSILALALGIAVNTAVFTAYKGFVARPLEGRDPRRLVNLTLRLQSGATGSLFSYPDYEAYRDGISSLSGVIAASIEELTLSGAPGVRTDRPLGSESLLSSVGLLPKSATNQEAVSAFIVSENYFAVLGVAPLRGRAFDTMTTAELRAAPSVLISENFWKQRFGADADIVGKTLRLNGASFTIAGITPADFTGTSIAVPNIWLPLHLYSLVHPRDGRLMDREDFCCRVFGRLAPGVTMEAAQAEATVVASRLRGLHDASSDRSKPTRVVISPGSPLPGINANLRLAVLLIMTAALMVLVIACANAAGLQLARATTRQLELGMRLSLGASRSRLIQQLLTESALIGVLAGATALPVSWALMRVAMTMAAAQLPSEFTLVLDVTPDAGVFAYVLALSVTAGLLFGLPPALTHTRSALFAVTRTTGGSHGRSRLRHGLIAAQVAVSLALMIAGSLLIRSAIQALTMDTGYDVDRLVAVTLQFSGPEAATTASQAALADEFRARLASIAEVTAISSARAPSDNGLRRAMVLPDHDETPERNTRGTVCYTWVQSNYFDTLGIPLLRGRGFGASAEHSRVAVVSEAAARRLWPSQEPIGQTVRLGTTGQFHAKGELVPDGPEWTVVGVARDTRGVTLDGSDSQQIYVPLPADRVQDYPILLRTDGDPALLLRTLAPVIAAADSRLVVSASTLRSMLRRTDPFLAASVSAAIASGIGLCGLLLVMTGIYSAVSYDVVSRTREVGIRMAIGAQTRDILGIVMRGSLRAVLVGLLVGVGLAVGVAQLLRRVLYGLGPVDAISFVAASLLFLTIAILASWIPSRRAMRIDPLTALRDQ